MRVVETLHVLLSKVAGDVHAARLKVLFAAVAALIRGRELTLSRLGRAISTRSFDKHGIKRMDRLLGNAALHRERPDIFRGLAAELLRGVARPRILVDWTHATKHEHCILVAAVAFDGRAITIFAETHPLKKLSNPRIEVGFFKQLKMILPPTTRPIVVMDAGFQAKTIKRIAALGFDYVVRIRSHRLLRTVASSSLPLRWGWQYSEDLYGLARGAATVLGEWEFTKATRLRCTLVGADRRSPPARRRLRKYPNAGAKLAARAAREPWLLITSLKDEPPSSIVNIYALRMQIEETFRDAKSHRFGWSLETSRSASPRRIDLLLLIAAIAAIAVLLVGVATERRNEHRRFQANSLRSRRVISLFALGCRVLARYPSWSTNLRSAGRWVRAVLREATR